MTTVFTIGYEGITPERFIELLELREVEKLVDVRDLPLSRRKGFSKTPLAEACRSNGIDYRHAGELGCPPEIRNAYRLDGNWQSYTKRFLAHLNQQDDAIAELAVEVLEQPTALVCFEADFNFCHRLYVARAVAKCLPGKIKIEHLTGPISGRIEFAGTAPVGRLAGKLG